MPYEVSYTKHVIDSKAKGQSETVSKPKLLAFDLLASWQRGLMRQTPNLRNGACTTVRGFESHTRRQMVTSPVKALTSTREKNRTAEAARFAKLSIRLLVVELKGIFHDLSFLPDRLPQIR